MADTASTASRLTTRGQVAAVPRSLQSSLLASCSATGLANRLFSKQQLGAVW